MLGTFLKVLIASLITIYSIKLMRTRLSTIYFSLNQIIEPKEKDISLIGLTITFIPPIAISFALCFFIRANYLEVVNLYALFTALLIIWPSIIYSHELLSYEVYKKENHYTSYMAYMFIYITWLR